MNKNWFNDMLSSFDLGHFIFCAYSSALIGFLVFPVILWVFIGLEYLFS